jgi:glycosyltransferase involved in cell wall biosynthesis
VKAQSILIICNKSPWPPKEGGPIAMNAMVEGLLNAGHNVKVLAINSHKYNVDLSSIPDEYKEKTKIELVHLDLRIKPVDAFLNLFSTQSYHVKRFISKDFSEALRKILLNNKFDIVQLETLFVAPYIPLIRQLSAARVILRAHNIEHLIWERLSINEKNPIKKWYLQHLTKTLKNFEINVLPELDGVVAITPKDAEFFKQKMNARKVISIPFGVNTERIEHFKPNESSGSSSQKTIFHLGSMNWMPNIEGIKWFLEKVWPGIVAIRKDIVFRIAGREIPAWLRNTNLENVIIDGEVPDALSYMQQHKIMVVPLFSGSGIRIKIIEGMMAGCAVITTTIGAEGIEYTNDKELIIANNEEQFAEAIAYLVDNTQKVEDLGKNAADFIMTTHNNQVLISKLESFYSTIKD